MFGEIVSIYIYIYIYFVNKAIFKDIGELLYRYLQLKKAKNKMLDTYVQRKIYVCMYTVYRETLVGASFGELTS